MENSACHPQIEQNRRPSVIPNRFIRLYEVRGAKAAVALFKSELNASCSKNREGHGARHILYLITVGK